MLVGADERCARCGTLLRGGRTVCPSCGLDQKSAEAHSIKAPAEQRVEEQPQPRPVQVKKSICPSCMSSVRDDSMVEYEGSRICPECYERMKGKLKPRK
jgi:uncharacterized Zn finger protein (UPF0148 family)